MNHKNQWLSMNILLNHSFSSSSIDKEIEILVVLWVNISRLTNPWSLRKNNAVHVVMILKA